MKQLVNFIPLHKFAHPREVRESEESLVRLIEEPKAGINVLLGHICAHTLSALPELILVYPARLLIVGEQSVHPSQSSFLLGHSLPKVDQAFSDLDASRIVIFSSDSHYV